MFNLIIISEQDISNKDLVSKTIEQVNKDFGDVELQLESVPVSENYFYDLVTDLSYTIDALLEKNPEKLFSLLYRIDLPEGLAHQMLASDNPHYNLSEIILKRELQKVVLRQRFSS